LGDMVWMYLGKRVSVSAYYRTNYPRLKGSRQGRENEESSTLTACTRPYI
jgi:hypothetical protein